MKDKEWAQKEIDRYLSYEGVNEARNALVFAKGVINQLDEPEVLSQEWIINNQERKGVHFFVNVTKLKNLVVPKQELPVIPKYVADWFEENKEHFEDGLKSAIKYREINDDPSEFDVWLDNPHNKPLQTLGNMFNGYEVEEEQKYYVIDKEDNILLIRGYGGIEKADNLKITNSGGGALKLTEQEIKDYDPRYWAFAERVEQADFRLSF